MDLPFALEGFVFEKVKGLTGQRVTFTFHYIIYAPASLHTLQRRLLLCCGQAAESNSAPFPAVHLSAVCRCTSQLLLCGSFFKRSTGSWVNGSTGQRLKRVTSQPCKYLDLAIALRGSFSKRSTAQRVKRLNRSTGQRVKQVYGSTGHFHFHYIIYDSRRRQAHATPLQKAHSVFCSLDG